MDEIDRVRLLEVARIAIERELYGDARPVEIEADRDSACVGGAFVTLRREERLRGCMGTFDTGPSQGAVVDRVARLACKDPRFIRDAVTADELPLIRIEISLLGPLERRADEDTPIIGKHGVFVRRGRKSGCFLPHVAAEMGWSTEKFLDQCCTAKAGLEADAWRRADTDVFLFEAQSFAEPNGTNVQAGETQRDQPR